MAIYSKDYLIRSFSEASEGVRRTTQGVLHWVTPLAATLLSLLCPLCSVAELPTHGRILICVAAVLLLWCLLVAIRSNICLVQYQVQERENLLNFLKNYQLYSTQLTAEEQMQKLLVGEIAKPIRYAYTALNLFAAALIVLFFVLILCLFPSYYEYLLNYC